MKRSKMARVCPFNNGVLMLRNISAPFLNALEDNPWWTLRGCCPENCLPFTGAKYGFCHFHSFQVHDKKRAFLNLLAKKKRPVLEHNSIYIYIFFGFDLYAQELAHTPHFERMRYSTPYFSNHPSQKETRRNMQDTRVSLL